MEVDMKRNLTLSLDEHLLRMARMVCQKRNMTVTQYIRNQLENMVSRDEAYQQSMDSIIALMEKRPIQVEPRTWTRDELHER
jgi:hypothetical protein